MGNLRKHLKTINKHKWEVFKACVHMGIPFRGLVHDLSKYSPTELKIAKWYNGTYSPHDVAREELGYSPSWYHHQNYNKHHWEYWTSYNKGEYNEKKEFIIKPEVVKIPYKYVIEMFCDFIGAGKVYNKATWTTSTPLTYWKAKGEGKRLMHKDSLELFVYLITLLSKCNNLKQFYKIYKYLKKFIKLRYKEEINLYHQLDRIHEDKINKILKIKKRSN